jgi:hypothetical protein
VYKLSVGSPEEKIALVALALKKGLAAADGLQGLEDLAESNPAALAAAEKQILDAALAAVNGLMTVAPKLFAPAQNLLSSLRQTLLGCLPFCSQVASMAKILSPKDSALIAEALDAVNSVADGHVPKVLVSTLESVVPKASVDLLVRTVEGTPDANTAETEPSPEASRQALPVSSVPGTTE